MRAGAGHPEPGAAARPAARPLAVRIEGLRIRVNAFPDPPNGPGGDDIPKMGGSGRGLEVSINRLVIQGGEFVLNHDRVPLDLDLPEFHGRLVDEPGQGLRGHVCFRPGDLRFGSGPELSLGTEMDLRFNRGLLTVEAGRVYTTGTDLGYQGRMRLRQSTPGPVQPRAARSTSPILEKHVMRSGLGLEGTGRWDGVLAVDGSRLRIEGRMDGTAGAFLGAAVPRFAGRVAYDGNGLRIRELDLESLGGAGATGRSTSPRVRPAGLACGSRAPSSRPTRRDCFGSSSAWELPALAPRPPGPWT